MNYTEQLDRLNEYQKAAVTDESSACLVNANVGSGKTTVLITKVMYLHYEKKIPYEQMVVLTFTNKAADEIKERLLALEPDIPEEQLWGFGTFHSVCLTILKTMLPVETLGYTKEFQVMDPDEELELAEQLITEHQLKIKYKNRLKKRLEQKNSKYQDDIDTLKILLKEEKKRQDTMTFDELLENTCKLLTLQNANGKKITWIIVDEVQDSDEKQLELIDCLKKPETSFFAVGDPNQVIYSWRGSAFHIFYQLKTKYQATELTLPVNYRSSSEILAVARCFMQQGGTLQGGTESGEKIQIRNMYDPFQEADYLAGRIRELHASGIPYREIAIFYRLQNQSEIFERVFEKEGIPFEVSIKKSAKNILEKEIHNEEDTIKLMTLHASKGLEFSHVFITGVNYGLIPLQTKSFEEEEEEQRLFFVGITRAKNHLELSYYTNPGQYWATPGPSRFLRMIPGKLIEGSAKDEKASATHLQDLKREIMAARAEKNPENPVPEQPRRVRHPKYGTGSIVKEDEMMITVNFDDYGEKEMMKMFSELEELS